MEFYPAELATPPLALVALLGLPDLHSKIGNYLRSNHRPPINSISVPEPSGAGRIFGEHVAWQHGCIHIPYDNAQADSNGAFAART